MVFQPLLTRKKMARKMVYVIVTIEIRAISTYLSDELISETQGHSLTYRPVIKDSKILQTGKSKSIF